MDTVVNMDKVISEASEPREIAEGVWWLPMCLVLPLVGQVTHLHNAPYLIVGSEKTLLFDAGTSFQWEQLDKSLDAVLGERTLDYVVPSHPEVPHCMGVPQLLDKYPGCTLVGDIRDYPLFFPQHIERMSHYPVGAELDLGSHTFRFVEAVIRDLPSSRWGYEVSQQVMFVADGFAYSHQPPLEDDDRPTHQPGECRMLATELAGEPGPEQIVWITRSALYWTRFVKMTWFLDAFKATLAANPVKIVAPAHGVVIDDLDILAIIWSALNLAYSPDEEGVKAAAAAAIGGGS